MLLGGRAVPQAGFGAFLRDLGFQKKVRGRVGRGYTREGADSAVRVVQAHMSMQTCKWAVCCLGRCVPMQMYLYVCVPLHVCGVGHLRLPLLVG